MYILELEFSHISSALFSAKMKEKILEITFIFYTWERKWIFDSSSSLFYHSRMDTMYLSLHAIIWKHSEAFISMAFSPSVCLLAYLLSSYTWNLECIHSIYAETINYPEALMTPEAQGIGIHSVLVWMKQHTYVTNDGCQMTMKRHQTQKVFSKFRCEKMNKKCLNSNKKDIGHMIGG